MASEQKPARKTVETAGSVMGLVVFLAGIAMIIVVFTMVRGVFDGVDQQMAAVRMASAQSSAAADTVTATPGAGPTFSEVGITVGLKMLGLLVLGWLGALVSSKGAQLAGAYGSKRE